MSQLNVREHRLAKEQLKVDNPDRLTTYGTPPPPKKRRKTKQEHNTICVGQDNIR